MPNTDKIDGGPAFPADNEANMNETMGMSLRDWFAGQALVGISSNAVEGFSLSPEQEADWAYQRADAMIAQRNKETT